MAGRRMIDKDAIRSRKLNSVSLGAGELWFRLLLLVDDNGNYFGDPLVVYANAMRSRKGVTAKMAEGFLKELVDVGLLEKYEVEEEDEPYIHIAKFHEYQSFKSDRPIKVEYPIHPHGPYFAETGRPQLVTRQETSGSQPGTRVEPTGTGSGVPILEVEVKEEVEVKAKVEESAEPADFSLTSQDLKTLKTVFREHCGVKAVITPKMAESVCGFANRYGFESFLDVIPKWAEEEGGRVAIANGKAKGKWAFANFLRDAEELLEAMKNGQLQPEGESGGEPPEIAKMPSGGPSLPKELML